jgi:phosphatidylglycerol:prolipoprotein diacylglycerol transferase
MHPILFRIPLPHMPLKLWWAAVAVAGLLALYALWSFRKNDRSTALWSVVLGAAAGAAGWYWRDVSWQAENVPIYSYGVMLGLSLVVGWYVTLPLAEKDGLDRETMANCYVITALAALAGSRLLYVATNPSEFQTFSDVLQIRRGGLVAYGGFIGGYLGSWGYLATKRIRLMPWADVAVPSLASGLLITRIGCYLYGCDFGKRLGEGAPAFLKKIGTFPHIPDGTLGYTEGGLPILGSPAYARHLALCREGIFKAAECKDLDASFPVHPTQLYESLLGLALLVILFWMRKRQKFRGQIFFTFAFLYGFGRFLLEILRDDVERGDVGPAMGEHVLVSGSLVLFAVAFAFGPALAFENPRVRTAARLLAFVPAIVAYVALRPATFGAVQVVKLSTSQAIGLLSAVAVGIFYARFWNEARKKPAYAMSEASLYMDERVAEKRDEEEEDEERPRKPKKGLKKAASKTAPKPALEAAPPPKKEEGEGDTGEEDQPAESSARAEPGKTAPPVRDEDEESDDDDDESDDEDDDDEDESDDDAPKKE